MSDLTTVKLRFFRTVPRSWVIPAVSFILFLFSSRLALGSERLCDASFENCEKPVLTLIQNENVEIDVAFWFMDDDSIEHALIQKAQAGVKIRMLVDPRANPAHPENATTLANFASVTPPIPMRKRTANGILHWKMLLFAGQGVVEFSGANLSPSEMLPATPYKNYVDEAIQYSDDPAIVNSFRTMYDKWWVDTQHYADHAHTAGMTLSPSYATYPIETEACAAVPHGCGMNFLPSSSQDDYGNKVEAAINAEKVKLDIDMFRITNAAITDATIAAFQRGLPVRVLVDAYEYSTTAFAWDRYNVDRLFMAGIPMKFTKHIGQNHEKSVLLYGQGISVWGSSNWTASSFNVQQEHNYFTTSPVKPWFFQWFVNHFERRWNSPQEYRAFVPLGPNVPVYHNPPNTATGQKQSLTLSWDGGPWGQRYDIYLAAGATSTPKLIASNVKTGSPDPRVLGAFSISNLAPNTTYRWQIVSKTMANLANSGPIWSFTTGGTAPTAGATVTSICVPSGSTCGPATGPSTGGTPVTITGTNFAAGATVTFGFATASKVVVVSPTTITAVTPPYANTGGSATVTVTNTAGDSGSLSGPGAFVYTQNLPVVTPRINVVVPNTGSTSGGTSITISGSNFVSGTTVTVGGATATITSRLTVAIVATTPPGAAGPADVVVTTPNGSTTLKSGFTYADPANPSGPPSVTGISPNSGSFNGGTRVIISGSGFQYGAVVTFGGAPKATGTTTPGTPATTMAVTYSPIVCGSGVPLPCIMATTPPFPVGSADVVVTNMDLATGVIDSGSAASALIGAYTFLMAPSISRVSPSSGAVSGGTQIAITGTNFKPGATVLVGNRQATVLNTSGTTFITAITPANTAGTATVTVVNLDGQGSNTLVLTYW
jgi:phosphatidylserine/phosphatidylglycerophosphate/cardiolipin synthase-like enzyme